MFRSSAYSVLVALWITFSVFGISMVYCFAPHISQVTRGKTTKSLPSMVRRYGNNQGSSDVLEYVFISMEEAEAALKEERMHFEMEKQEMKSLLEEQRRQLAELTGRQSRNCSNAKRKASTRVGLVTPDPVDLNFVAQVGSSSIATSSSLSANHAFQEMAMKWPDTESGLMQQQQHQEHLRNIENQLRHVMSENEQLMKRMEDQHRNFQIEKRELQDRLMEERKRLQHIREELNMERVYFETSRKLLENLLETEQKKVMALQEELFSRDMMDGQFQFGGPDTARLHKDFNHFSNGKQQQQEQQHARRNGKHNRARPGGQVGLEMNMNDIRSPLYP